MHPRRLTDRFARRGLLWPSKRHASPGAGGRAAPNESRRAQADDQSDRRGGFTPFFVAGTSGTVDIGAIDDLDQLAEIANQNALWMHVDSAYGALGILSPEVAPRLVGIEATDSLAFDFHKWGQVPYDAGFVLLRDGELHRKAFASPAVTWNARHAAWPPDCNGRATSGRTCRADSVR